MVRKLPPILLARAAGLHRWYIPSSWGDSDSRIDPTHSITLQTELYRLARFVRGRTKDLKTGTVLFDVLSNNTKERYNLIPGVHPSSSVTNGSDQARHLWCGEYASIWIRNRTTTSRKTVQRYVIDILRRNISGGLVLQLFGCIVATKSCRLNIMPEGDRLPECDTALNN